MRDPADGRGVRGAVQVRPDGGGVLLGQRHGEDSNFTKDTLSLTLSDSKESVSWLEEDFLRFEK